MTPSSALDGRIFEFNFSNLFNKDFMFNPQPATFSFLSWAILLGTMGVIFSVVLWYFSRKRRNFWTLDRDRRHLINFHSKINLVLMLVYLLLVFLRTQEMKYLSMRFLAYFILLLSLVNFLILVIRYFRVKKEEAMIDAPKQADNYQKYLPKPKRK